MKYSLPDGVVFEIPDKWLVEAGLAGFIPTTPCYLAAPLAQFPQQVITNIPITEIKPVHRAEGVQLDFGGFDEARMKSVLRAITQNMAMEPIQVVPEQNEQFKFRIYDGFHRFHAAIAAGFTHIPAAIDKWGFSGSQ